MLQYHKCFFKPVLDAVKKANKICVERLMTI